MSPLVSPAERALQRTTAAAATVERQHVVVIGLGFLGSIFLDEFARRAFAKPIPVDFVLIDAEEVEPKNAANQNFLVTDAGTPKTQIFRERLRHMKLAVHDTHHERLTQENLHFLLKSARLIVDAVDNLATRQLLWSYGMAHAVPVLHLGLTPDGVGKVEWTAPDQDSFSLAPQYTIGRKVTDPQSVEAPCELVRMRAAGVLTGLAGAVALSIFLGFDPEGHLGQGDHDVFGWMTDWRATHAGLTPERELWRRLNA